MWWNFLNNIKLYHLIIPIIGFILVIIGLVTIVKWIF